MRDLRHKARADSPAAVLMGEHHRVHHRSHHHRKDHYDDGGDVVGSAADNRMGMPQVTPRRETPNMTQQFRRGGHAKHRHARHHMHAMGGQMEMEDRLRPMGTYSSHGGEMEYEDRRRSRGGALHHGHHGHPLKARKHHRAPHRAMGGDIGTNTGSSIAREPGREAIGYCHGGKAMKRAMGGAGKTRKHYPYT